MKKVLFQFSIGVFLFLGTWYLLSKINFVRILRVETISKKNEQKLGEVLYDYIKLESKEIKPDSITDITGRIKRRICEMNGIDPASIKIHILKNPDINAFAIPGHQLVIFTGLIGYSKNPEELAGIMAHEIAHIEHNHVMKKMVKEVGVAGVASMIGGQNGSQVIARLAKVVTSTAFDRDQEKDADATAVHYMVKAKINPSFFAGFFIRFSNDINQIPKELEWISTHPDTKERAERVRSLIPASLKSSPIATQKEWSCFKEEVKRDL
ncbi:MAG: M48 family metallopeptidase [Bacteroidota bacterium]|nr:M48 family metallopeptidase [Bacteroidota bacterium]MDP4204482.1 M48 family metallopeptidase [Bacteroidota bacterium]